MGSFPEQIFLAVHCGDGVSVVLGPAARFEMFFSLLGLTGGAAVDPR